jgi:ribonuclease P protein component
LLHRADFDRVYSTGRRVGSPLFTAFVLRNESGGSGVSHVGFTTPRALGNSVVRNRIRRRLREVIRLQYADLAPGWDVVMNPRRNILDAPRVRIEEEVRRLFSTLAALPAEKASP